MELSEMKALWDDMSQQLAQQNILNKKIIMQMTKQRFQNKISTIGKFEGGGSVICIIAAIVILFNIGKMDTLWLLIASIVCVTFLILGPYYSLSSYRKMKGIDIQNQNYQEVINTFIKSRKRFLRVQKIILISSIFFMISIIPVFNRIGHGSGESAPESSNWIWLIGLLFLVPFSLWGFRKYSNMTASAQRILEDLAE